MRLTRDDLKVEEHLSNVPALTAMLCAELGLYASEAAAARGLSRLERVGLVRSAVFNVRHAQVEGPLYRFPEDGELNPYELEAEIRNRYGASKRERLFSLGEFRRPLQVDHEMGAAGVKVVAAKLNVIRCGAWVPDLG